MKVVYIIIFTIFIFSFQSKSYSQCCAAGNPVSSNCSIANYGMDVFGISLYHIYSNSNIYFNGTERMDKKYNETEFNFSYISLYYGITNELRVTADIGYFFNKSQNFVNQDYERYAEGLGDLNLGFSYDTYQSENKEFNINQTARLTLPVGVFNQVYDGIELPIDLQPSSGNIKYNFGITFSKRFGNSGFSLYSINSFEISQFIETTTSKYKYGNLYNISLLGSYQIIDELSGILQIRTEIRDKALNGNKNQDNLFAFINASGGVIAFVSPQLSYTIANKWTASLQYNYPFYKNVNGEQLTNHYSIQAGISTNLNFSEHELIIDEDIIQDKVRDPNILKQTITVYGNCEMCKSRIEAVTNEFKNVIYSEWDSDKNKLSIYYKDDIPNIMDIAKKIAEVGHDNEIFKADDAVYKNLPKCCLYR